MPAPDNPYCIKCGLCNHRAKNFLEPQGADDPWITVVFDGVSWKEDDANEVATEGSRNGHVRRTMEDLAKSIGFPIERIRWLPITRCANRIKAQVNYRTKGNWCRVFAVEDLMIHPPRLVLAVGSVPLGLLSHKGNAFDWSGKILTWRGWPDDWLTAAQYDEGHPSLPRPSMDTLPLYAVQAPHIITALQNMRETARWKGQLREAMELAMEGAVVPDFNRDYFKLLEDPDAIIAALRAIPDGTLTTYDSETMGLLPWAPGAAIVAMMFRYDHPEDGPVCFGFPWDFPESPLKPHLSKILPVLLETFYRLKLQGHNLTFDILYAYATLKADLRKITQAMACDTRHLIYTLHQTKESLGLELVAYRWCPDMAGYEEEFTLIKDHTALADYLDPGKDEGGHYSRALLLGDEVKKAYTTYIMGDVEVCHIGAINIRKKLDSAKIYPFPLADPGHLGRFRPFTPPARSFVYDKIMLPANRMLTRLMGQGMQVNLAELEHQENIFPKMIKEARLKLREMDDQVAQWCEEQEATTVGKDGKTWQLDLESRDQLKHILFNIMKLPVKRLTKSGIKKYGEKIEEVPAEHLMEFAAVDKYTINALAAEHADRLALPDGTVPLMDYRKLYKAYTAFVRSMRNVTTEGIDKSDRKQPPYLQTDGRVHASFNLCGTRSGRLGCSRPNLAQLPSSQKVIVKRQYSSRWGNAGCIYQGDLSQIELRLLAAACGDPLMVDAYQRGIDLHSLTASNIFEIPYEHLHKDYFAWLQKNGRDKEAKDLERKRSIAKTTNFLTGYGGGSFGLQTTLAEEQVYLDQEECENIIDAMFDTYPTLRRYIGVYKNFILEHGCAVSIFGRVRPLPEVESEDNQLVNKSLRAGFNHLIQSTASDMMLLGMSVIDQALFDQNLKSCLVSTVHDSLVVDAQISELPLVHEIVTGVINNLPEILDAVLGPNYDTTWCRILPLTGDTELGRNYFDQKKTDGFKDASGEVDWDKVKKHLSQDHSS